MFVWGRYRESTRELQMSTLNTLGARRLGAHVPVLAAVIVATAVRTVASRHRTCLVVVVRLAAASIDGVMSITVLPDPLLDRDSLTLPVVTAGWSVGFTLSWGLVAWVALSRRRHVRPVLLAAARLLAVILRSLLDRDISCPRRGGSRPLRRSIVAPGNRVLCLLVRGEV